MPEITQYLQDRGKTDSDFAKRIAEMFQQISDRLTAIEEAVIPDEVQTNGD